MNIGGSGPIERLTGADLMQLAADVGPVPAQVGAVLLLDTATGFDPAAATQVIAERLVAVPRLRQVLVDQPPGCGRPVWVDDAGFDVRRHVGVTGCPPPGDETALLDVAVAAAGEPLPRDRPLWRAVFVTGLAGPRVALVLVFHHVLADGIGGLAVLANLVDGAPPPPASPFPRPAPTRRDLAREALRARVAWLRSRRGTAAALRAAMTELGPVRRATAPVTTLNRPTGPRRRLLVTRVALSDMRVVAHAHGATVNDVVLAAATGALGGLLARRGERVASLVFSVPVSARAAAAAADIGNRVGVMAVALPVTGHLDERLERIAAITGAHKTATRGGSAAVLGLAFRVLRSIGLLRWFIDRQRLVNVFETNVHGPDVELSFAGHRIVDLLPVTVISGNVGISFAVLSYAGRLAVVVVADPDRQPDAPVLATLLQHELDGVAAEARALAVSPDAARTGGPSSAYR